ncbi:MAG: nickel-dependent hydrogenase family protein [Firmicutes bacterium]|nr:nickel-dependent hydrogenase family protein [Bacillota bacterium]
MENKRRVIKKILQHLGDCLLGIEDGANEIVFNIMKQDLPEVSRYIYQEQKARLFTMVGNDERQINGRFALYYVFVLDEIHHFITVKIFLEESDPTFPSLADYMPALNWYEREVNDLLGLRAIGHPDRSPLIFHGDWPETAYPLRKDYVHSKMVSCHKETENFVEYTGEDVTEIPVGPIHAGIIEPGHFRFGAVGDTVLHLDARLFYTHRGIEKELEGKTFAQAMFLIERVCCVCNVSHSVAFAEAVETAANITIPERAKYIRTLYLELERLYNHVGDVGNICAGYGFAVGNSQGTRMREMLLRLNEELTGHRYLRGAIALGGVSQDIRKDEIDRITNYLNELDPDFQELVDILLAHEIAVDRMETTGCLSLKQVTDLEAVGITARASGRDIDCRRDLPYAAYDQLNFAVIVQNEGDVLARINVRILEVFNSILLIRQILKDLPEGDIVMEIPNIAPYTTSLGWTESARGENCHWLMVDKDNKIYRYRIRSAAYSNWPVVPLAVPGNIVADFPLINKSFELCYSCCDR